MSRPWKHPRTGFYWFRKAIPSDLRRILGKREEKFSLRTKNPGEAQALHARRAAEIAEKWARLRGNAPLDHADLFGLAGEMYRDMLAKNQRNPGGPGQWLAEIEKYTRDRFSPLTGFYSVVRQNREFRYGAEARKFLADRGYILDQAQFSTFVVAFVDAATGARLNEVTQARQSDIKPEVNPDDRNEIIWMLDITPEAGTVKTGMARKVPIHPHLIEQGFLSYVQTRVGLPLFYDPKRARKKSAENPYFKKIGERLGEWVHSIGIEKDVQPSHAWRHLFKSVGRYAQIPEDVLDTLQGHQARGEGAKYGSHWPQMSYRWIKQIPRYELNAPSISDPGLKISPRSRTGKASRSPKKRLLAPSLD